MMTAPSPVHSSPAARYQRICHAYIQLADQYEQLDVEQMKLKEHLVHLLQAIKAYQQTQENLQQENHQLRSRHAANQHQLTHQADEISSLKARLQALEPLEALLSDEMQRQLLEVEDQIELVEATKDEIDTEPDPDLSTDEKALLSSYLDHPDTYEAVPPIAANHPDHIDGHSHDPAFTLKSSQPPLWEHLFDDPESVAHMKGF